MEARRGVRAALCVEEAEGMLKELGSELEMAGVVLPSPGIGPVSLVAEVSSWLGELGESGCCGGVSARRSVAAPTGVTR